MHARDSWFRTGLLCLFAVLALPLMAPNCLGDLSIDSISPTQDEQICAETVDVVVDFSRAPLGTSVISATLVEGIDTTPAQTDVSNLFLLPVGSSTATAPLPLSVDGRAFLSLNIDEQGDGSPAEAYATTTFERQLALGDACGVCNGDGTGATGCPLNCGGLGPCECDVCNCPVPFFGPSCVCNEVVAEYNGFFQSSSIGDVPETLMISGGESLSFEGWIYPTKAPVPIIDRQGAGAHWLLSIGVPTDPVPPNVLRIRTGNSCPTCQFQGVGTIFLNEWTHIAFTWDAATDELAFYINGDLDSQGTFTPSGAGAGVTSFATGSGVFYGGFFDEFRFWSSVRSEAEIADNWETSLIGYETDLFMNQNFQQWTAGDVESVDSTPSGNNWVHALFVTQAGPSLRPPVQKPLECPSDCNNAGTCTCGVCSCTEFTDLTFDCGESGGGG